VLATVAVVPTIASSQPVEVRIHHFAFAPADVSVAAGSTVRWINEDAIEHTVTSQTGPGTLVPSGEFDSPLLLEGDVFEHTFDITGTYYYFCRPHGSSMQGVVRVTAACDADVNCDGSPDQGDVACIILAVAGDASCLCGDADFNLDGSIDQGDVAAIIRVIAGEPCP